MPSGKTLNYILIRDMKTRQKSRRQNETRSVTSELQQEVKVGLRESDGHRRPLGPEEEKQQNRARTQVCHPGSQGELTSA